VFLSFWMTLAFVVALFGARLKLLKGVEKLLGLPLCVPRIAAAISRLVTRVQQESSVVYFTKSGNLCRLNKALLYVKRNEDTNHCRIVHLWEDASSVPRHLVHMGQILDAMYPSVRIDTVFVKGKFGPAVIDQLSREWNVPTNLMFITCPTSTDAGKRLKDLHGVRVIMSHEDELVEENQPRDTSVGLRSLSLPVPGESGATASAFLASLVQEGRARAHSWTGHAAGTADSSDALPPHLNSDSSPNRGSTRRASEPVSSNGSCLLSGDALARAVLNRSGS